MMRERADRLITFVIFFITNSQTYSLLKKKTKKQDEIFYFKLNFMRIGIAAFKSRLELKLMLKSANKFTSKLTRSEIL